MKHAAQKQKSSVFYKAMLARDPRFDGKFFVGVKTTGVYCRPICPAKPKRENVEFFSSHVEAEHAGYRPCLRCRPESAPRSPAWIGTSALVRRAVRVLNSDHTLEFNEESFAEQFGVSSRHLRRLFTDEIGKTPKQLFLENRLGLARKLLGETSLPMTEIAHASGFKSVRRFNDAFKDRFHRTPSEVRRQRSNRDPGLEVTLSYRPPFDFKGLLESYRKHQVGNLEWFEDDRMFRVVETNGKIGTIEISDDPENSRLRLKIDVTDLSMLHGLIARVRSLFDLDSDPLLVAESAEKVPSIRKLLGKSPGIRLPSGWDAFEISISTILGQLVTVERGRKLVHQLIELLGQDTGLVREGQKIKLFPTPDEIAQSDLEGLGTTGARKQALRAFAAAVRDGQVSLEPTQDVEEFMASLLAIRGIGRWTADYMALKVLRDTDSFPATDLILARAIEKRPKDFLHAMRPWRGYAAALIWRHGHR